MPVDRRLFVKGTHEPLQPLLAQGRYSLALAEKHAAALAENNWAAGETDGLKTSLAELDTHRARQLDERAEARRMTRDQGTAISDAKSLINRVRNVARIVVRRNPAVGVSADEFNAGAELGRQARRISDFLMRLRVPATKLDQAFQPYFKGASLAKLIDDARARLDAAATAQDVDAAELPADTARVVEAKGRLLEQIEDLNAIARNAFADDPTIRARFNKDLLNQGRRGITPTEADADAATSDDADAATSDDTPEPQG